MSVPESIVQAQMEALLRRVAREQEMLSRRARDAAEEQARGIVARAREEARARTRQAAEEARQSVERALADRRAALETAARQREQSLLRELMDKAWQSLPRELDTRMAGRGCATRVVRGGLRARAPHRDGQRRRSRSNSTRPHRRTPPSAPAGRSQEPGQADRRAPAWRASVPGCASATGSPAWTPPLTGLLASRERIEAELLAELDALLEQPGEEAHVSQAVITWIGGPVLRARMTGPFSVYEAVSVGPRRLLGEVIQLKGEELVAQVYEDTTGLEPGDTVAGTGRALSVNLGPGLLGGIFDGLLRPLTGGDDFQVQAGLGTGTGGRFRFSAAGDPRRRTRHGRLAGHRSSAARHAADPGAAGRGRPPRVARRRGRVRRGRADRAARRRATARSTKSRCATRGRCARRDRCARACPPAAR